jgi:hypothetical protein
MNFRKNASILTLLLVLVVALLAIKAPHYELIWSVLLIFVIKAESRPQPIPVVLLALATTITSILVLSNFKGMGRLSETATIVLLVPLVLSKWLFRPRTG